MGLLRGVASARMRGSDEVGWGRLLVFGMQGIMYGGEGIPDYVEGSSFKTRRLERYLLAYI